MSSKKPLKMAKNDVNGISAIASSILACQRAAKVYNEGF